MASEIKTWHGRALVGSPPRQLFWGEGPPRERAIGIARVTLQIEGAPKPGCVAEWVIRVQFPSPANEG